MLSRYGSKKDSRRHHDVLVPLATFSGVTTGLEFGVFGHTPPKMGSSARPYGTRRLILFPPQNYHGQSIGSALLASPFAFFVAFPQKHDPNVSSNVISALRASPFERRKCPSPKFFSPVDVCLAVSDVLRSTPTTPSVHKHNIPIVQCQRVTKVLTTVI